VVEEFGIEGLEDGKLMRVAERIMQREVKRGTANERREPRHRFFARARIIKRRARFRQDVFNETMANLESMSCFYELAPIACELLRKVF
jgi:hypothetical protein